jgi:hypothetical protein
VSIEIMSQVWKQAQLAGTELLVLLAVADHARDDGFCWPSIPYVAEKARLSKRQAQRVLHKLTEAGYLDMIEVGRGRGHKSGFRVYPNGDAPSRKDDTGDTLPVQKGDTDDTVSVDKKVTPATPKEPEKVTSRAIKGDIPPHTRDLTLTTKERVNSFRPREAAPKQRVDAAAEIGVSPKLLTTLTNTLLDLTGGRALADAGDEYKLRDAQDAAILLARIGYGSADALKELGDSWRKANEWRNSLPSIRNLKDYAGQRAAGTNGKSRESSWADLNQGVPEYMKG